MDEQFTLNIAVQGDATKRMMVFSVPDHGVAIEIIVRQGDFETDSQSRVLAMLVADLPELVGEAIDHARGAAAQ